MKIALIGEAPGKEEEAIGIPFVGQAGQELSRMLAEAGINRAECFVTNVFNERPGTFYARKTGLPRPETANDLKWAQVPRHEAEGFSALSGGVYLNPEYTRPNLARLFDELEATKPALIVAFGNTALWALTGETGIGKYRGTVLWSEQFQTKILPTYHPAAVLREWTYRPIVVADLIKAKEESTTTEMPSPTFNIFIPETVFDLSMCRPIIQATELLSVDIETSHQQITCIGFSPNDKQAVVIPFWKTDPEQKTVGSYWSEEDEKVAWKFVKEILESPIPKVGQNFMYDLTYLLAQNIRVRNFIHDTMIMHHSLHPELEKSLAFLGSIYTNKPAWKQLRPRGRKSSKKDE